MSWLLLSSPLSPAMKQTQEPIGGKKDAINIVKDISHSPKQNIPHYNNKKIKKIHTCQSQNSTESLMPNKIYVAPNKSEDGSGIYFFIILSIIAMILIILY